MTHYKRTIVRDSRVHNNRTDKVKRMIQAATTRRDSATSAAGRTINDQHPAESSHQVQKRIKIYDPMANDSWRRVHFQLRVPGWPDGFTGELRMLDAMEPNGDHSNILGLCTPLDFRHRLVLAFPDGKFNNNRPGTASAR